MQTYDKDGCHVEPGQDWKVDLFRPEDAEGVAGLFLSVYGESYPIKEYINPQLLVEANASGRVISMVARTPKGDIVGHTALFRSAPYSGVYEAGAGAVHRDYRGRKGIFTRMVACGMDVAADKPGVEGVFGESVCNHVFSQKMCHGLGWITVAVEVDLMPASAYEKEKSASGRVASLLDFKTVRPRPHRVHIPAVYENAIKFIYTGLDDEREIVIATGKIPPGSDTRIESRYFGFAAVARLAIWEPGQDFSTAYEEEERKVLERGASVIQAWLNLSRPWAGEAADILRERGYFLGGIPPRWFDTDGLLLINIFHRPHCDGIKIQFDRAGEVLRVARNDWENSLKRQ